ncbi:MAG TPA: hypothetical protein VLZ83_08625 [Edaphocola sp.]|nr:hypothetical protein [Edaphocola sp.]
MVAFREKFQIEKLQIKKVGSWIISLRPQQVTLGSLVLSLDRACPHFGEITEEEGKELSQTFKIIENLLNASFKADKINYLALMMVDHQVHYHVIPRYETKRVFDKIEFIDQDWPMPPSLSNIVELSNESHLKLKETMINAIE